MAIQDLAGNALQAGPDAIGQMLGFVEPLAPEEVLPLEMYRFILESIRTEDAKGTLFLKRYLEGPQSIWRTTQEAIFQIKELWSVTEIEDRLLPFLKRIVGWTPDLDSITDPLDADTLRRLIATSVALWKKRGVEDALANVLSLTTGARLRVWNWFDFRWVLGETEMSEEHEGRDPWIINLPGPPDLDEYRSNLRIVDDSTLNRTLVEDLVKLMRPVSERIEVSYIDFLDLFAVEKDNAQWTALAGALPTVADGLAVFVDSAAAISLANRIDAVDWKNYIAFWRVRGDSGGGPDGGFGGMFYASDENNGYQAVLDTDANLVKLISIASGTPSTLATAPFLIASGAFYGLRVDVQGEGATNRIKIYIDAVKAIEATNAAHSSGSLGMVQGADAINVNFDEVEMFQLPLDTTLIDINS